MEKIRVNLLKICLLFLSKFAKLMPLPRGIFSSMSQIKDNINVGVIGHGGHGKTTLTSAILYILAKQGMANYKSYDELCKGHSIDKVRNNQNVVKASQHPLVIEEGRGGNENKRKDPLDIVTVNCSHVEYETQAKHYSHTDCPGSPKYTEEMIKGISQLDCAILVISAEDGPMPQTREHLILAKEIGVKKIVVFVNKIDLIDDNDLIEELKREILSLFIIYGFKSEEITIVCGSAKMALEGQYEGIMSITELLGALDKYTVPNQREGEALVMPIEKTFPCNDDIIITGKIIRGGVQVNDSIEVLTPKGKITSKVKSIKSFKTELEKAKCGQDIGLFLSGINKKMFRNGGVVISPDSISNCNKIKASLNILDKHDGGRHTPFFSGFSPRFYFKTGKTTGRIKLNDDFSVVMPGEKTVSEIELISPLVIEKDQRFVIREGNKTIGFGTVIEILK